MDFATIVFRKDWFLESVYHYLVKGSLARAGIVIFIFAQVDKARL